MLSDLLFRVRAMFHRSAVENELDDELRFHFDRQVEKYVQSGVPRAEALRRARLEFGGLDQIKEECRDVRGVALLETVVQDVRYGLRILRQNPTFTLIAVSTLALGIAVNTALFTAYADFALRPLQATDPGRMTNVYFSSQGYNFRSNFSYPAYAYYRDYNRHLTALLAVASEGLLMSGVSGSGMMPATGAPLVGGFRMPGFVGSGDSEPIVGELVSENYFQVLGTQAALGRTFLPSENRGPGSDPVVLLGYDFWERRFNSDPAILGRTLKLNGFPLTIIGVTPRGFMGTSYSMPNVWIPMMMQSQMDPGNPWINDRNTVRCQLFARLQPGVTSEQAAQDLTALAAQLQKAYPRDQIGEARGHFVLTAGSLMPPLDADVIAAVVFGLSACGLVLLIACANVASLMLARAVTRRREIAVRLALGASRHRLIRQLLTESTLVGLAAGGTGVAFSYWVLDLLLFKAQEILPANMAAAFGGHLVPNYHVFVYTLLLSFLASVGFGLAPALQATKLDLSSTLKEEGASYALPVGRGRFRFALRDVLLAIQVAVCLLLLVTAGLLARSSGKEWTVDPGFDVHALLVVKIWEQHRGQDEPAWKEEVQHLLSQQLAAIPGVRSTAVASAVPLEGGSFALPISLNLNELPDREHSSWVYYGRVSPTYFDTIGIAIVSGRNFTAQEAQSGANVVVVSEATARRLWPGENPLGKQVAYGDPHSEVRTLRAAKPFSPASTVIGVAKDIRSVSRQQLDPTYFYLPLNPAKDWGDFLVRTAGDPQAIERAIPRAMELTGKQLTGFVLDEGSQMAFDPVFVIARVGAILSGAIGLLGLALAAVGIYGTVGYAVTCRTHEIGVRLALGAHRMDVHWLFLGQTLRPVAVGLATGLPLAAGVAYVLNTQLYGLSPLDPVTFCAACGFLCVVALLASYFPARRAMRVDPMVALRHE